MQGAVQTRKKRREGGRPKHDSMIIIPKKILLIFFQPAAASVPYDVALENMKTLFSSTESRESLHEQVTKLNKKALRLEEEKEKWMLEAQLFKIKYEKQQKVR